MKRHNPTRLAGKRSFAVYAIACALLFVLLTPSLFACVVAASAPLDACVCCTHTHANSTPNSACCTTSHVPAALPARIPTASRTAHMASAYSAPVITAIVLATQPAAIHIGSPPGISPTPLRI
jgi:hypothetical protein